MVKVHRLVRCCSENERSSDAYNSSFALIVFAFTHLKVYLGVAEVAS